MYVDSNYEQYFLLRVSPEYSYPTHSPSMSLPTLLPSAMPTSECSTIELYQGVCNTQQGVNWVVAVDSSTEVSRDDYDEIKAWVVDFVPFF